MTYEQRQVILDTQVRAETMLRKITKGRVYSELSPAEYARTEYWHGKLIGIGSVLRTLGVTLHR